VQFVEDLQKQQGSMLTTSTNQRNALSERKSYKI
jgi:hypothetical protein